MPDGITHTTHTAVLAIGVAGGIAAAAVLCPSPALAGWALAGVLLTPDLDVYPNITYTLVERVLGRPGRFVWEAVWRPYAMLMPHRGVSHAPVVGTATRVAWLLMWLGALDLVAHAVMGRLAAPVLVGAVRWLSSPGGREAFAFLALSDALHALMDAASTVSKGGELPWWASIAEVVREALRV